MAWFHLALVALVGSVAAQTPFTLEDIVQGRFSQRGFNGVWVSGYDIMSAICLIKLEYVHGGDYCFSNISRTDYAGHEFTYTNSDPNDVGIYIYNAVTNSSEELVSHELMNQLDTRSPVLSSDRSYILAPSQVQQVYRYSRTAIYTLHNVNTEVRTQVADGVRLELCIFGSGHNLAYVLNNDLYYQPENNAPAIRITFDGIPGVIYNGHADWVYEEDVFYTGQATWFSPDGNHIAFASFDDTEVETYSYYYYVDKTDPEDVYPEKIDLKYPKAGTRNPTIKLRVLRLDNLAASPESNDFIVLDAPEDMTDDHIVGGVTWVSPTEIAVQWLNRRQNIAILRIFNVVTNTVVLDDRDEQPDGWVPLGLPKFSSDGEYYLSLKWSLPQSDGNRWQHLFQTMRFGNEVISHSMTPGTFTVDTFLGVDEENVLFFFTRTNQGAPYTRSIHALGSRRNCITCGICTWASGSLSRDGRYLAVTCNTADDPARVFIYDTRADQIIVENWEENRNVIDRLNERILPKHFIEMIQLDNFVRVPVRVFLPPTFDENDHETKYPVVFYVYSGPNTNAVSESFSVGYHSYLTTNRSVIYMMADGHGSGRQGMNMLYSVNNRLGTVEIEDHIIILRQVLARYPYMDASRVGIWGHSYGGYATLMTLIRDEQNLFKCGISTAPVTSWLYYNTMYTERFMGVPTERDNLAGYEAGDVTLQAEKLRNKDFLLMHGNADDNVHFQNAAKLMTALQKKNIEFEQMSYPDEAHSLGRRAGLHRYSTMDRFWTRCLDLDR